MAVKLNIEIDGLEKLLKKLDYRLVKDDLDDAVKHTADDAAPRNAYVGFSDQVAVTSGIYAPVFVAPMSVTAAADRKSVGP